MGGRLLLLHQEEKRDAALENEEELVKSDLICHDMRVWGQGVTRGVARARRQRQGRQDSMKGVLLAVSPRCVWRGGCCGGHEGGGGCCPGAFMCGGRDQHSLGAVWQEEGGRGRERRERGGLAGGVKTGWRREGERYREEAEVVTREDWLRVLAGGMGKEGRERKRRRKRER